MKIFIGTTEIAGYYSNLVNGLRRLGYNAKFYCYNKHPHGYLGEEKINIIRHIQRIYNLQLSTSGSKMFYVFFRIYFYMLQFVFGSIMILRYDAFIFGYGTSLFPRNLDLPILKFLGKKVVVNVAHGSESRPPYMNGVYKHNNKSNTANIDALVQRSEEIKRKINFLEKHVTFLISAPFSSQFYSKRVINFFALGLPNQVNDIKNNHTGDNKLRVIHAPSRPILKGTPLIRDAISILKTEFENLDYIELQGVSNAKVMQELAKADLVIDQAYSDTPLAGLAAEAATFGVPSVVGGFGLNNIHAFIPNDMMPPSFCCRPDDLVEKIRNALTNHEMRIKTGKEAKKFIEDKWSVERIASCFVEILEGRVPESWWLDPSCIMYFQGVGLDEQEIKSNVLKICQKYGKDKLFLQHNPILERELIMFADAEKFA